MESPITPGFAAIELASPLGSANLEKRFFIWAEPESRPEFRILRQTVGK